MPLADDTRAVRDRALAELRAAHDYYADSVGMWEAVKADVTTAGRVVAYTNPVTGTATTGAELATRINRYVTRELRAATLVAFLAVFEAFVADLVRAWLRAYPHAMADKSGVPVDVILDAPDKPALVDLLIDRTVAGLFYQNPADWFAYLEKHLKVAGPAPADVARLAEAKATRDVLMHNGGVANDKYVRKAAGLARHPAGEIVDLPDAYHHAVWELLLKLTADLSAAVLVKFP